MRQNIAIPTACFFSKRTIATLRLVGSLGALLTVASVTRADFVRVIEPTGSSWGHADILEATYSRGVPFAPFGDRVDDDGDQVDFTNGVLSAIRVDDLQLPSPMSTALGRPGDVTDQLWFGGVVSARAIARFAGYRQTFGYASADDGAYVELFAVRGRNMNVRGAAVVSLGTTESIVWARGIQPRLWYSDPARNTNGDDHLVTYEITGIDDGLKRWMLFWEDLDGLGDQDYTDLVVELTTPIPEPAAIAAIGLVLALLPRRRA